MPGFLSSENFSITSLCKTILISGLLLYLISIFLFNNSDCPASDFFSPIRFKQTPSSKPNVTDDSPTTINHLVFGLVGSVEAWKDRKPYIESWWRPEVTKGYLYLDKYPTRDLLPWPESSPRFKVSDNLTELLEETKHVAPIMVRMVHAILEVFRNNHEEDIRWYVMGDDDSMFFVDNWVDVLSKYDHTKSIYIGGQSETILSNFYYSFDMGFGGAGFALSYPLVEAMVEDLENCFRRYPYLTSADQITMTCIADLGVPFTSNRGIHQFDLRGDISGFLSAHPQFPTLSLHHFDAIDPIFPNKDRAKSSYHLMKAANLDQSRLLQQTVCYHKQTEWSFSISWGYSANIYEKIISKSILKIPIETFKPWLQHADAPYYMFNTRRSSNDSCESPHVFFLESVGKSYWNNKIVSSYVRASPRGLPACSSSGNNSADRILEVQVFTPAVKRIETGRSECCDIVKLSGRVAKVKFRACMKNEIIA